MSRDLITVSGPDAGTYLQGQLSQDVLGLEVGGSAPTLLLEPSGKLGYWFGVTRTGDDAFELHVDGGFGERVVARLQRFKIRTTADIVLAAGDPAPSESSDPGEADRIAAGIPKLGAEIVDGVIPAELGQALIERSVSFTKGCYTGQELVARVDSRGGNVPRHLRRLVVDGDAVPPPGAEILVGDRVVGVVTSAAVSAPAGAVVALGFVQRAVVPPEGAALRWADGSAAARVEPLPGDAQAD